MLIVSHHCIPESNMYVGKLTSRMPARRGNNHPERNEEATGMLMSDE